MPVFKKIAWVFSSPPSVLLSAMLQRKDDQILALLNEKIKLFNDMCGSGSREDTASAIRMLFRACNDDVPKGENIMKEAIREGK